MNRRPRRRSDAPSGAVRIIGGRWRGTKLPVADADGLRPTSDRVRETLFNWLQPMLPGARVLDLFAGSGALGLEAVSRGAREALLVERDPRLAEAMRQSVTRLNAEADVSVAVADAAAWLRAPLHGRFDLVFLDPPFATDLASRVLPLLGPWLSDAAWLYLESPLSLPAEPGPEWRPHRSGSTREVHYALYERRPGPAPQPSGAAATLADGPRTDDA